MNHILKLIFYLFLLFSIKLYSQEFPIGVFLNTSDDTSYTRNNNYQQVRNSGVNTVLQYIKNSNQDSLAIFDNIIATNLDRAEDLIHHYSSGYYTRWEAEDTVVGIVPGIKLITGSVTQNDCRAIVGTDQIDTFLVDGPDYIQDRKYRLLYTPYFGASVEYKVNFRLRTTPPFIGGNGSFGGNSPLQTYNICEISVVYRTQSGNDSTLASKVLTSDSLSYIYDNYSLTYTIPDSIGNEPATIHRQEFNPIDKIGYPDKSGETAFGVKFRVKWFGNYNLYCDYIEVYDKEIWEEYLDDSGTFNNLIKSYAQQFSGWSNLRSWYSLDEPRTIDNYEPYRIVDSVLNSAADTLITTFHPNWDGDRNNEFSVKRFVDNASPKRLMINYYPLWYNETFNYGLQTQRQTTQRLFDDTDIENEDVDDYWFVTQAMGFYSRDSLGVLDTAWSKPRITPEQMRASTFLALSQGAKGIMFDPAPLL
ncbi:MAG: hypothetical protein K8F36_13400 [Melioribacteraceae bacterium]|nr:hypothetical protein [Melioribacteraceae bacterium]